MFDDESNFHLYKSKLAQFGYKKIELPFASDPNIYAFMVLVHLDEKLTEDDKLFTQVETKKIIRNITMQLFSMRIPDLKLVV